jgi:PAS domain S-box-containing protein
VGAPLEQAWEERQLALLVLTASDYAIFMLDPDGRVRTWNTGAERMKGYAREEIVGRHFSAFYTPEDVARDHPANELRIAARDGRYEEEGWRVRKDGTRFWANVVITAIHDAGELVGFGKVSRDLTVRRLAEERSRWRAKQLEAVNAELAEYRRLVTSVRDYAIFMLDPTGRVKTWNTGARQLKGYDAEEIIGEHFSVFYTASDRARDHPGEELQVARREGRYEEEGRRVRKDGTTFWAGVTITAVHDDEGRLTGFAKVTRDLSERKEAEDALRAAVDELRSANAELDHFATFAAHDLATPLTTIEGFADLLLRAELPEPERAYAEHIHASSERLAETLRGLLAYARSGRPQRPPGPVDLGTVLGQVLADLAGPIARRAVRVSVAVPEGATLLADPADVGLVLQNLVTNAVKFSHPERPALAVGAERVDPGAWRVVVEDNGSGIADADRERIFRAFERAGTVTGTPGHGLGLAICQRLVDRHGGRIGVDSTPGQGSRFWFELPAAGA